MLVERQTFHKAAVEVLLELLAGSSSMAAPIPVLLGLVTDTLAERLRRRPAKPMGSPRVGSNPTGVVSLLCYVFRC